MEIRLMMDILVGVCLVASMVSALYSYAAAKAVQKVLREFHFIAADYCWAVAKVNEQAETLCLQEKRLEEEIRKRLAAEETRDGALMALSGKMDLDIGFEEFKPEAQEEKA